MALGKYGILLKKYLKEYKPIKYSELTINCTLMDYLYKKEKELIEYKAFIEKQLKQTYPEPKTNEFIVMASYNNMIESIVEEYVLNKINENHT